MLIDVIATVGKVRLPTLVPRIDDQNIAFPILRQVISVLHTVLFVLEDVPSVAHSVLCCIPKSTETEVIIHCFHAVSMLCSNVILQHLCHDLSVGNVLIRCEEFSFLIYSEGRMLLVLPVIELYSVHMTAVEECHFPLNHVLCLAFVIV